MFRIILTLFAACAITSALPRHGFFPRIMGGEPAKPGQFPSTVSIQFIDGAFSGHWCGASIINTKWVVTAAHCMVEVTADTILVLAGTTLLDTGGTKYTVASIFAHPDYNDTIYTDDIALVELQDEFSLDEFTNIIQIGNASGNESCTVVGWGQTDFSFGPHELQNANLSALSDEDCTKFAEGGQFIFDRGPGQICGLASKGISPCYGDSGGPLICDNKLVGVVSYAIYPCGLGFPDVYSRVAYYEDWISEIVGSSGKN